MGTNRSLCFHNTEQQQGTVYTKFFPNLAHSLCWDILYTEICFIETDMYWNQSYTLEIPLVWKACIMVKFQLKEKYSDELFENRDTVCLSHWLGMFLAFESPFGLSLLFMKYPEPQAWLSAFELSKTQS